MPSAPCFIIFLFIGIKGCTRSSPSLISYLVTKYYRCMNSAVQYSMKFIISLNHKIYSLPGVWTTFYVNFLLELTLSIWLKIIINSCLIIFSPYVFVAVADAVKTVSVMEGESATVPTGVIEIQGYDLILWKFKDNSVAEINKGTNQFLVYDSGDVRFKGRLKLNEKSGSLIISNSRTTDSGDYHLNMSSSSHTLQRTISVTVSGE